MGEGVTSRFFSHVICPQEIIESCNVKVVYVKPVEKQNYGEPLI
jgi:hypothetical protein